MLDYFIKVLLFQILFLAVYDIVLKKETFFQWNRAYLISTSVLAYVLPSVKIQNVAQAVPQEYVVWLPEVMLSPQAVIKESIDWSAILFTSLRWIFLLGVVITTLLFIVKIVKLITIVNKNEKEKARYYNLVHLNSTSAFSFFNYIFLGKHISKENRAQIIKHELVHVKQKHSVDLLFFELQKIGCWFNPFSYIYQNRISELHEFIADSKSIKQEDKKSYFQNILAEAFSTQKISFINHFFKHSLMKKRIVMLNKTKSKRLLKFKYLLMLPLLVAMLIYSSCEKENFENDIVENKNKKRLVKLYLAGPKDKEYKELTSKREGYFDIYMLAAKPLDARAISYEDLTDEEKNAFEEIKLRSDKTSGQVSRSYKLYEHESGKKSIREIINWEKSIEYSKKKRLYKEANDIYSFDEIDEAPVFPGCENEISPKHCFNQKISEFIKKSFDISKVQKLEIKPGSKKIYVKFRIKKTGEIEVVNIRAPHPELKSQVNRIIDKLPVMTPGKLNGKPINVNYVFPISFNVE